MTTRNSRSLTKEETKALKNFGKKVRSIRTSKQLTLEECEELGFPSWRNLSDIENGQNCTLLTMLRIAKVLQVRPSELMD